MYVSFCIFLGGREGGVFCSDVFWGVFCFSVFCWCFFVFFVFCVAFLCVCVCVCVFLLAYSIHLPDSVPLFPVLSHALDRLTNALALAQVSENDMPSTLDFPHFFGRGEFGINDFYI